MITQVCECNRYK